LFKGKIVAEGTLLADRNECIAALNSVALDAGESVTKALLETEGRCSGVFVAGNGGSAATTSHMTNDNHVVFTSTGNYLGSDHVFSRELRRLAQTQDLLIAVSVLGNSQNVLACVEAAKELGLIIEAFIGFDSGRLATMAVLFARIPTIEGTYGPVQDFHVMVNHMITEQLKDVN